MRKLTHKEIVTRQEKQRQKSPIPLTIVLDNIRSLYNVGSIFRTGDGAGVEKIWLCGITGYPPQAQISKIALGAEERVPWEHAQDVESVVRNLKGQGYTIIFLEQMEEAVDYYDFKPNFPLCLVVGNEIEGISKQLLPLGDGAIEIEMMGIKNSLNVSVAFGIVAYHLKHSYNCL